MAPLLYLQFQTIYKVDSAVFPVFWSNLCRIVSRALRFMLLFQLVSFFVKRASSSGQRQKFFISVISDFLPSLFVSELSWIVWPPIGRKKLGNNFLSTFAVGLISG